MMTSSLKIVLLILSTFFVGDASAQVGITECACYPSLYEFTLDFSAICEDTSFPGNSQGQGISGFDCFSIGLDPEEDVTDTVPVDVSAVTLVEINEDNNPIKETTFGQGFRDGDSFTYVPLIVTNATLTPGQIPSGLQMTFFATNQFGQQIQQIWILQFANLCGIFPPIVSVGDQIGWTILVRRFICFWFYLVLPHSNLF